MGCGGATRGVDALGVEFGWTVGTTQRSAEQREQRGSQRYRSVAVCVDGYLGRAGSIERPLQRFPGISGGLNQSPPASERAAPPPLTLLLLLLPSTREIAWLLTIGGPPHAEPRNRPAVLWHGDAQRLDPDRSGSGSCELSRRQRVEVVPRSQNTAGGPKRQTRAFNPVNSSCLFQCALFCSRRRDPGATDWLCCVQSAQSAATPDWFQTSAAPRDSKPIWGVQYLAAG